MSLCPIPDAVGGRRFAIRLAAIVGLLLQLLSAPAAGPSPPPAFPDRLAAVAAICHGGDGSASDAPADHAPPPCATCPFCACLSASPPLLAAAPPALPARRTADLGTEPPWPPSRAPPASPARPAYPRGPPVQA